MQFSIARSSALLATAAGAVAATVALAPAAAAAPADPQQALFNLGAPVYELVGIETLSGTVGPHPMAFDAPPTPASNNQYLHLKRITAPDARTAGVTKYVIVGKALPDEFWTAADSTGMRGPSVLTAPKPWPHSTAFDRVGASLLPLPALPLPAGIGPVSFALATDQVGLSGS